MVLTNSQIQALIVTPLTTSFPKLKGKVLDTMLTGGRQVFPSVQIENRGPDQQIKDVKLRDVSQLFRIHLYWRIAGTGSDEVATVQQVQNNIFNTLDAATLAGSKLFREVKNWSQMETVPTPVRHVYCYLDVTTLDIQSESGVGLIGAYMTLTILGQTVKVLSETTDEGRNSKRVADDVGNTQVIPQENVGSKFLEYEYVIAAYNAIEAGIVARSYTTATLNENGTNRVMTVLPVRQRSSVRYDGLKTTILQLEIVSG